MWAEQLEDSWEALRWAAQTFREEPMVVAGDSAGGNLATVLTYRARAAGPGLAAQVLFYPVTDHDLSRASYHEYAGGEYLLTSTDMAWFWDQYLPDGDRRADPEASPLRQPDPTGLPPAVVVVAGHDPLRDEIDEYAARLASAGNDVAVLRYPAMGHGFISLIGVVEEASAVFEDVAGCLHRILRPMARARAARPMPTPSPDSHAPKNGRTNAR